MNSIEYIPICQNNTREVNDIEELIIMLKQTIIVEPTYAEVLSSLPKNKKRKNARENDYPEFDEYITMNKRTKSSR